MSESTFGALGVPSDFVALLARHGIHEPFPIQAAVIPETLAGRDVAGRAPTGSGKTLAFGLPLVAGLTQAKRRRPTALVLSPTRELALQIAEELRPFAKARRHDVVAIYGGVGYGPQRKSLDAGAELVVACPGRLEDLISTGAVTLSDVRVVVVDEADRMADMGFLPAVRRIIEQTNEERQVLLFSATFDGAVGKLSAAVQRNPARHEVGPAGPDVTAAEHLFWTVGRADRDTVTAQITRTYGSTMVFCRTRRGADQLAQKLHRAGVAAAPIHGGRSQAQREKALRSFTKGAVSVLVATDVASRGVHVDDVAAVVHFDPPEDGSTYVHRSGRTARAGASGVVISLIDKGGERATKRLLREVGVDVKISTPTLKADTHVARVVEDAPRFAEEQRPRSRPAQPKVYKPISKQNAADRRSGTVTFFHDLRGYGFIDGGEREDLFVHHSSLGSKIASGQRVEFEVRQGRRGLEAFDVVAL